MEPHETEGINKKERKWCSYVKFNGTGSWRTAGSGDDDIPASEETLKFTCER